MANYESFLPEVLPEVSGVPEMVAINAIRNAVIEFCHRTQVWHYQPTTFHATAGKFDYVANTDFVLPTKTLIAQLNFVYYEKDQLEITNQDRLDNVAYNWRSREASLPTRAYMVDSTTIRFVATPEVITTDGIDIGVFLKPDRTSTSIGDDIYDEYLEGIAYGAISRLQGMNGKPWSNVALSVRNKHLFNIAIGKARIRSSKGYGRGSKIVNLKPFGGSFDGA